MANKISNEDGRAFRPRARIMRTLGEELISSETVAVLELVKNAYDADAGYVLVRFEESLDEGEGALCVEDNGHGMSLQVVEAAWMEPATNLKKKVKTSQFLNRRLLGEKGVGRFAAARLAYDLELSTRAVESDKEVYAYFDWSQFDNEETYLDQVLILAEEREPSELVKGREIPNGPQSGVTLLPRDGSHGTVLRMNGLKRTWGNKELDELRRGLSRLISPFDGDHNFKIFFQLPEQSDETAQELEPPEVIKYPHYTLAGEVDELGKFVFSVTLHAAGTNEEFIGQLKRSAKNNDIVETKDESMPEGKELVMCGPFSFNILVWDRDQLDNIDQKIGTGIRNIRKDLDSVAGISIFRDGFRVLPYGEPENDWLKLDLRRVQNPTFRLSNNQITGYIRIGADTNPLLRDQSNREGLDNNQAYADLQEIIRVALSKLEALRYKEKKPKQKDDAVTADKPSLFGLPDTSALRQKLAGPDSDPETLELFDDTTKAWEAQIVRIREVVSRYHALATMGQLVDKVIHDGRQPLSTIQVQTSLAREAISQKYKKAELDSDCNEVLGSVDVRLERVKEAASLIDLLLKRIEPLGGRRKGRPSKVYMNEIIRSAFSHFSHDIENLGIKVTLPAADDLVQVDALELQEVLINLISNSIYWLGQVPKTRRSIIVECARPVPGEVDIIFADSGPGIPNTNRASIFDPYFTTKPDGVGLGLVIAGEIIRDYYDGSLELLNAGPLPGAVFRIKLRKRV